MELVNDPPVPVTISKCCFCFKNASFDSQYQLNMIGTRGKFEDVYKNCKRYISEIYLQEVEFLNWVQPNPLPFCSKCLHWTAKIARTNTKLEQIQKTIDHLVKSFTAEFIHLRENPNIRDKDPDLDVSTLKNDSLSKQPIDAEVNRSEIQIKQELHDGTDFEDSLNAEHSPLFDHESFDDDLLTPVEVKPEILKKEAKVYVKRKKKKSSTAKKSTKKLNTTVTVNLRRIKFDSDGNPILDSELLPRRKAAIKAEETFLSGIGDNEDLSDIDEPLNDPLASEDGLEASSSEDEKPSKKTVRKKPKNQSTPRKNQRNNDHGEKRFKCLQCNKSYKKGRYLRDHQLTHDKSKRFQCTLCDVSYSYIRNLRQHLFKHENNSIPPDERPEEKKFKCQYCDKTYNVVYRLKEHERTHDKGKRFECSVCGVSYAYIRSLRHHLFEAHQLYLKCENETLSVTSEKPYNTNPTYRLDCKDCGKVCTSINQLHYHRAITHKARPKTCKICNQEFKNSEALKTHKRTTHKQKPQQSHFCMECKKEFKTSSGLKDHIKRHNRDPSEKFAEKKFTCEVCQKMFTQRGGLNVHMLIHKQVKRFECTFKCGKWFATRSNLNDHLIYHKGERAFLCEECGKSFFTKGKLKNHTRIHTGLLHFCEFCGKGFQTTTHLKQHHRSHNKKGDEYTVPLAPPP